jgi:Primosomal protein N'' (replication factor Y) - superfamily II helicase
MYAEVCVDRPAPGLPDTLTYEVPKGLRDEIGVGAYVLVPLQRQRIPGYVVGIRDTTDLEQTRRLSDLLDPLPYFDEDMVRLARWTAAYYHARLCDVLRAMAPPMARRKLHPVVDLTDRAQAELRYSQLSLMGRPAAALLEYLIDHPQAVSIRKLRRRFGADLDVMIHELETEGLVQRKQGLDDPPP